MYVIAYLEYIFYPITNISENRRDHRFKIKNNLMIFLQEKIELQRRY